MKKLNGYINITKLCADGQKQFKNWFRNDSSERLVQALINQLSSEALLNSHVNSNIWLDGSAHIRAEPFNCIIKVMTTMETNEENLICDAYIH